MCRGCGQKTRVTRYPTTPTPVAPAPRPAPTPPASKPDAKTTPLDKIMGLKRVGK